MKFRGRHGPTIALLLTGSCLLFTAAWSAPPTAAPAAGTHIKALAPVAVTGVAAVKAEVHALQEIKVALKRPISGDPRDANLTVCQLEVQSHDVREQKTGLMGVMLECGSNSWWLYRRDNCQSQSIADCASGLQTSTFKREGMWHNMRFLNFRQVMVLRKLTDTLPPPGSTRTIVVTGYHGSQSRAPAASSKP